MEQSSILQLIDWVYGESVHNDECKECCPDFSCCHPELLAEEDERWEFLTACLQEDEEKKMGMLGIFLHRLMMIGHPMTDLAIVG